MRVIAAAVAALLVTVSNGASVGDEIGNLRDDIRGLCMRLYTVYPRSGLPAANSCRYVWASDSQRHVVNECFKSGWSGQGSLRCKYGVEMFDGARNDVSAGDSAVHKGANNQDAGGRVGRRMEVDGVDAASATDNVVSTDVFRLENLTDEADETLLPGHKFGKSLCILQGMEVIPTEDPAIRSACNVRMDEDKNWILSMTSAKCHVQCTPWH